ncbi:hypothetical protein HPB50_016777 [Hyalomma asiaticum]|uniref:Uncharacterized protein n=1 Tax=Hyalomma asiaticum TaxID=266040 RepID=A0ACB7RZJ6_HYAAI|nr:hypothetical protein HPB50_016777 [Hyalomma asiaticum]
MIWGHGIRTLEPYGLPLGMTTLAEELRRRDYSTHAFGNVMHVVDWFPTLLSATGVKHSSDDIDGVDHWSVIRDGTGDAPRKEFVYNLDLKGNKLFGAIRWHLGYCNSSLTPTRRGFDTFRGYYLGSQDYFSHTASVGKNGPEAAGYDYWKNESVDYSAQGHYSTYLIADHVIETIEDKSKKNGSLFLYVAFQAAHAPSQVPRGYQANCSSHANKKRVKLCGALNGGHVRYGGNNWPLRGNKNTLYEGGTRVPAFVSGSLLKRTNTTSSRRV